jgi:hypothetical protein
MTLQASNPRREHSLLRPETKKMTKGSSLVLMVLLAAAAPSFAQQPTQPAAPAQVPGQSTQAVPWSSLSGEQQKLLGKFGDSWNTLPPERQQALARGSNRWLGMTPEQRGQAQKRFQQWHSLPPEQRSALRDRWNRFQSLPPDQQAAVRQNFHRFRQLPPERRQMLRQRWQSASPAERQMMIQRARERQHMRNMEMRGAGPHGAPHAPPPQRPHR